MECERIRFANCRLVHIVSARGNGNLSCYPDKGKSISEHSEERALLLRRKKARYGHVLIYRVRGKQIVVLRFFHTAQDWRGHMTGGDK